MKFASGAAVNAHIVDPYNPLGLPPFTIRCKFSSGYTPTMGDSQTLVDAGENIWDIYKNSTDWTSLFNNNSNLSEIFGANTSEVTNMTRMFYGCGNLTSITLFDTHNVYSFAFMFNSIADLNSPKITNIPLFDTSSANDVSTMFGGCKVVQSGALALYQQMSTQANPPLNHGSCFRNCGSNTVTGAAELAQIPSDWGGTAS